MRLIVYHLLNFVIFVQNVFISSGLTAVASNVDRLSKLPYCISQASALNWAAVHVYSVTKCYIAALCNTALIRVSFDE